MAGIKILSVDNDVTKVFVGSAFKKIIEEHIQQFITYREDSPELYEDDEIAEAKALNKYMTTTFLESDVVVDANFVDWHVMEIHHEMERYKDRLTNDMKRYFIETKTAEPCSKEQWDNGEIFASSGGYKGYKWFTYQGQDYAFDKWFHTR